VLTESLVQEHERAAGAWHAEWNALSGALLYAGGAVAAIREVTEGLEVDPERMRRNLASGGGLLMAEQAALALTAGMGTVDAHAIVAELSKRVSADGGSLRDELAADERVRRHLSEEEIDAALDPVAALEAAGPLVDAALARHRSEPA
jgi:3-carboxy-cis,cis-muconate cycloisomerase